MLMDRFKGNAHENPYLMDPKSNLTEFFDKFPNPFNLIAAVCAYRGRLGPSLRKVDH